MGASVFRSAFTGVGPMAAEIAVPAGRVFRVVSVTLHLNAAAVTSENLTITLDATNGANYDTLLYSLDLAAGATVSLLWQPDEPLYLVGNDELDILWANTDGRTWGMLVTVEVVT